MPAPLHRRRRGPKIRDFLREAATEGLKLIAKKGEPLIVGVRDRGAADHPTSSQQERDVLPS
jgi:hypothetical protein